MSDLGKWLRVGVVIASCLIPAAASSDSLTAAEEAVQATPDERATLTIVAMFVSDALELTPIPRRAFIVTKEGSETSGQTVKTGFDGRAEIELAAGVYSVRNAASVEFGGKSFDWNLEVHLEQGRRTTLEISNDNAEANGTGVASTAPTPTAVEAPRVVAAEGGLAEAQQVSPAVAPPAPEAQPAAAAWAYSADTVRDAALQSDIRPRDYHLKFGQFDVQFTDPVVIAHQAVQEDLAAARQESEGLGAAEQQDTYTPGTDFYEWSTHSKDYRPVVRISAIPESESTSTAGSSAATRFKTDFDRMELRRSGTLVEPIDSGRVEENGFYGVSEYAPDAFRPGAELELSVWEQGKSKPKVRQVPDALMVGIWSHFEPFHEAIIAEARNPAPLAEAGGTNVHSPLAAEMSIESNCANVSEVAQQLAAARLDPQEFTDADRCVFAHLVEHPDWHSRGDLIREMPLSRDVVIGSILHLQNSKVIRWQGTGMGPEYRFAK